MAEELEIKEQVEANSPETEKKAGKDFKKSKRGKNLPKKTQKTKKSQKK